MGTPGASEKRTKDSVQLEYPLWDGSEHRDHGNDKSPKFQEPKSIPGPSHSRRRNAQELRDLILQTRLSLRELRTRVGRQGARIREMEVRLWDELRSHRYNTKDLNREMLDELHEEISHALDIVGPEEEEYNEKEDDLNVLEYRLEGLEADLYNDSTTGTSEIMARPQSLTTISSRRNSTTTMRSQRYQPDSDVNSPMHQYLSKLGDARIIRERLHELRSQRSQYLDIQLEREALGLPQYQPNIDFLADYEKIFDEEFSRLQVVEKDVAMLAQKTGLEPANPSGELANDAMNTDSSQVATPSPPRQIIAATSASPQPALTLTNFSTLSATFAARQRINEWILLILEISPLERARHKAVLGNPDLDDMEWASLVGKYWQRNQAIFDEEPWRSPIPTVIERRQICPQNRSRRGSPGVVKPVLDSGEFDFNQHSLERSSYDTDSLIADATGPNSSTFLGSSFSSIPQLGGGHQGTSESGNGFRPSIIASKLGQVSSTYVEEKPVFGVQDELRKGLFPRKVRKHATLIARLDLWSGDQYQPTWDSDNESLAEEVVDCFIGDIEGDFESIDYSKLHSRPYRMNIKVA